MEFEVWFPQSYHPAIKSNLKKFQEIPVAIGLILFSTPSSFLNLREN